MNGSYPQPSPYPQTPPRPSGGSGSCFLKGCLVVVVVVMLLGVITGGIGWYVSRSVGAYFTHDPKPIHPVEDGDAKFAAAQAKLVKFNQTLAAGRPDVLTLTADDLNGLVAHDPRLADVRGRLYLSIVNNQIVAEISFPLNDDKSARGDQRLFLDARIVLDASYASGDFTFQLARVEALDGQPLSATLLGFARAYLNAINLGFNRGIHEHPENNKDLLQFTDQLRTVVIKDNTIVATSVDQPKPAATPAPSPAASPVADAPQTN